MYPFLTKAIAKVSFGTHWLELDAIKVTSNQTAQNAFYYFWNWSNLLPSWDWAIKLSNKIGFLCLNLNEFDFYVFSRSINQNQLQCSSQLFRSHHVTSIPFDSIHMRNIDAFDVFVKWVLLLFDLTILNDFRMTHCSLRQQFHLHMPQKYIWKSYFKSIH